MAKKRDERVRNWVFILYPESAPENWKDMLQEMAIPCAISPLHDKDKNADGEDKKPHYHIMLLFDGNKSYDQIKEITDQFNASVPQKCLSVRGTVRYFCHLDNPEKWQYSEKDIITYGGVDTVDLLKKSASFRYNTLIEMYDFVKQHQVTEITALLDYCRSEGLEDWFVMLCDGQATIVKEAIKSIRHQIKDNEVDLLKDSLIRLEQNFAIYTAAKEKVIYTVLCYNCVSLKSSDFEEAHKYYIERVNQFGVDNVQILTNYKEE